MPLRYCVALAFLRDWQYTPTRKVFVQRVEARVAKHLRGESLERSPVRPPPARFDDSAGNICETRFHVAAEASKRMNEKLSTAPTLGSGSTSSGSLCWARRVLRHLITTARSSASRNPVWLIESFFDSDHVPDREAAVCGLLLFDVPSLLEENIAEAAEARKG